MSRPRTVLRIALGATAPNSRIGLPRHGGGLGQAGWPGLRFTEGPDTRQRLPTDDLVHVNFGHPALPARLGAAIVLSLASAPLPVAFVSLATAR